MTINKIDMKNNESGDHDVMPRQSRERRSRSSFDLSIFAAEKDKIKKSDKKSHCFGCFKRK